MGVAELWNDRDCSIDLEGMNFVKDREVHTSTCMYLVLVNER